MNQEEKAAKANDIVTNHVGFAASAGLIPIPGADLAAVTAVQLNMLRQLAKLYNVNFMENIGMVIIEFMMRKNMILDEKCILVISMPKHY